MPRRRSLGGRCAWAPSSRCRSPAAGPTRCPRAPLPSRFLETRLGSRAPRASPARRHQGQDPCARGVRLAFRAAGAGEGWAPWRARSRTPGSRSPERPGALPVRPESPQPPLSLAAPKDRPGYRVSRGHRERGTIWQSPPPTWVPGPALGGFRRASGEAQTGADQPPSSLRFAQKPG